MKILTDTGLMVLWNKIKQLVLGNRPYNPSEFSGKGYKVLEKNIQTIGGVKKNILTAVMLSEANTIYEIRYDFDLNGETIEMQEGCTLKFKGGSLSNGNLNLQNTKLSGKVELTTLLFGTFENNIFYTKYINAEYFYNNVCKVINNLVNICANSKAILHINSGEYIISSLENPDNVCINIPNNIIIEGDGYDNTILRLNPDLYKNRYIKLFSAKTVENVKISNLQLDCNGRNGIITDIESYFFLFNADIAKNVCIKGCKVYDNPSRQSIRIGANTEHKSKNIEIRNCVFDVSGNDSAGGKKQGDHSSVYINANNVIIANNLFMNNTELTESSIFNVCSAIELHSDNVRCYGNYIKNHKSGVNVVATVANHINSIYTNNIFERVASAFDFWCMGNHKLDNIQVFNNIIKKASNNNAAFNFNNCNSGFGNINIYGNDISYIDESKEISYFSSVFAWNKQKKGNLFIMNNHIHDYPSGVFYAFKNSDDGEKLNLYFQNNVISKCGNSEGTSESLFIGLGIYNCTLGDLIVSGNTFVNCSENMIPLKLYKGFIDKYVCVNNFLDKYSLGNYTVGDKGVLADTCIVKNNSAPIVNLLDISANKVEANSWNENTLTIKTNTGSFPASIHNISYGKSIPTSGTNEVGNMVINMDGLNNSVFGWLCIERGTPGEWRPFGRQYPSKEFIGHTFYRPKLTNNDEGFTFYDADIKKNILWNGLSWVNTDGTPLNINNVGTTEDRPSNVDIGFIYKDTTLNKLILWEGTRWVNLDGTEL